MRDLWDSCAGCCLPKTFAAPGGVARRGCVPCPSSHGATPAAHAPTSALPLAARRPNPSGDGTLRFWDGENSREPRQIARLANPALGAD